MQAVPIEAPQGISPSGSGLVGSAYDSPAAQAVGNRWEGGFEFVPEHCAEPESWIIPCAGSGAAGGPGAQITENRTPNTGTVRWTPYVVRSSFTCTAQSAESINFRERAQRIHTNGISKLIETELYRGDAAGYARNQATPAFDQPNLTLGAPDTVAHPGAILTTGGATTPTLGIRALVQAAADAPGGRRAMLHATPATAMAWAQSESIIRSRDGRWITSIGEHPVIIGAGYEGSAPDLQPPGDNIHWAWITTPVYLLLGAEQEILFEFDRDANDGKAIVQRTACAYWDNCLHAGIPIHTMGTIV